MRKLGKVEQTPAENDAELRPGWFSREIAQIPTMYRMSRLQQRLPSTAARASRARSAQSR